MPERLCKTDKAENGISVVIIPGSSAAEARQVLEALQRQIAAIAASSDIKGIIITGSGEGFCRTAAGTALSHIQASELASLGQQVMFSLEKTGRPCIAAVGGVCSGLGLELALACDFIVASDTASFGLPGIAAGQIPFCGGTQRLARLVGKSRAKEMIYSGEMITAGEAFRIKLINRLYAAKDLMSEAVRLMTLICSRSPNAIRIGGEVINAGYDIDLQTACLLERNAFALCFASYDQREGMQAFLDKRQPGFKGE
ncbi:MAG: enoyl-CoA hydratase/isomerase family protein [Deltaproteobacteria bacterium]|nr:enoyl-CoA hydratase/isomerase family protein [Deltaproteobacteria bacterium]